MDNRGREFDILIVKATYEFDANFELVFSTHQHEINVTDQCYEDFNTSSLFYPSDLVAYKPYADIHVLANAYSANGEPKSNWLCGVRVEGQNTAEKIIRVTGERHWQSNLIDQDTEMRNINPEPAKVEWELSEPRQVTSVPVRYEAAFGGMINEAEDDQEPFFHAFEKNPIGTGLLSDRYTDPRFPVRAPQIEAFDDPVNDPFKEYTPQGFGPIPPAWLPRRPLGGTYDQNWIDNIWPNWPPDYKFEYHNSAHPDMIYAGFLEGDEVVQLAALRPEKNNIKFTLPDQIPFIYLRKKSDGLLHAQKMALDTLRIDLLSDTLSDCKVVMTWRMPFVEDEIEEIWIQSTDGLSASERASLLPKLAAPLHPSELFKSEVS